MKPWVILLPDMTTERERKRNVLLTLKLLPCSAPKSLEEMHEDAWRMAGVGDVGGQGSGLCFIVLCSKFNLLLITASGNIRI